MPTPRPARRRWPLARQLLLAQLATVGLLLVAVGTVSWTQSSREVQRVESRRALATAENLAAAAVVREALAVPSAGPAAWNDALAAVTETARSVSGADGVMVLGADDAVVVSSDPRQVGTTFRPQVPGAASPSSRAWTGLTEQAGEQTVTALVPVLSDTGALVGRVGVQREYPDLQERLRDAWPDFLAYLGLAGILGVAGSSLVARRVKRQTLGLEPREITRLAQDRDAVLQAMREGVLGLGPDLRVTLLNAPAAELLSVGPDSLGRHLDDLGLHANTRGVLRGDVDGQDLPVVERGRFLVANRVPVAQGGRDLGSVTTLRDLTDLVTLQQELGATRSTGDLLRAQTHEFANRLHTISGLIQLGEFDAVTGYVDSLQRSRANLDERITSRVLDPAVAALLTAKTSVATERRVTMVVDEKCSMSRVDDDDSLAVCTVLGNLLDNAVDAAGEGGRVDVTVRDVVEDGRAWVRVEVHDSGSGIAAEPTDTVFDQGFSTKQTTTVGGRGFGLALTRTVCEQRGGRVSVRNAEDGGAEFTALVAVGPEPVAGQEERP